jgi:esterase
MAGDAVLHTTNVEGDGAAPGRWALMLHGVYGRGRNWASVAKLVAARRPEWGIVLVDLRLHGDSPPKPPPHTVSAAADDVAVLARQLEAAGRPVRAIVAHSFGGKVALALAPRLADSLEQVWIIDSTPDAREPAGSAWEMLAIVRSLPPRFASRAEATAALERQGLAPATAAWMATNLRRDADGVGWALDFEAIEIMLRDFFATDLWPVVEQPPGRVSLHFVKAMDSSTLSDAVCARLDAIARRNSRVHLHRVSGGHWVNTENPAAVVDLLAGELPSGAG